MAVQIYIVIWVMTPFSNVVVYQHFRGSCFCHLRSR